MLARTSLKQVRNVVRGNQFSMLTFTEEFPTREVGLQKASSAPATQAKALDNGIKVVARQTGSNFATLRFAVLGGSSSESSAQKGAANYLAAAAYAGNRSNTGLRVVRFLESLGATFSASADREKIVYDVSVLAALVEPATEAILSSIATPPLHAHVLEEVRDTAGLGYEAFNGCSQAQLAELIQEAAFGETSGFGASKYAANLNNLGINDVLDYRATHFVKENLVIAADGLGFDKIKDILDILTPKFPTGKAVTLGKPAFVGGDVRVRVDLGGKTNVAVAFPAAGGEAAKNYEVLYNVFANRLANKGVCASAFYTKYTNGGLIGFTTRGAPSDVDRILRAAVDEFKGIASNASDAEVIKTKVALANFEALNSRSSAAYLLDSYLAGVDANKAADTRTVSAASVADAAKAALKAAPAYAVLGATAGTPSYSTVSKIVA